MDYVPIIISGISLMGTAFSAYMTYRMQKNAKRQEKELQSLKNEHELLMLKSREVTDRENRYEDHRVQVVADYLRTAKVFLGAPYNIEAYADFNRVAGEILMYLPEHLRTETQAMTQTIDEIRNNHDDYGYDEALIRKAQLRFYRLSESFSDLGLKPPSV